MHRLYNTIKRKALNRRRLFMYEKDSYFIFDSHRAIEINIEDCVHGILEATLINFDSGIVESKSQRLLFTLGRFNLPYDYNTLRTDIRTDNEHYLIKNKEDYKLLSVIHGRFFRKTPLISEIKMENPYIIGCVSDCDNKRGKAVCSIRRVLGYSCTGEVSVGDDVYAFNNANGIYKSIRCVKSDKPCYTARFSGKINGNILGADISVAYHGKNGSCQGVVFYNGTYIAPGDVSITENKVMDTYKIISGDGMLNLTFTPYTQIDTKKGILLGKNGIRKYGSFSGKIILQNGADLNVDNILGSLYVAD
ncbi:MAG: DUF2804 family protein [Clostridiales bacterium]|nr:DUF2804 family protein [Clostridiales bacterium]